MWHHVLLQLGLLFPSAETHWRCSLTTLTMTMTDLVVRETNRFAVLANTGTTWETSAEEIRTYLGFHILMGINRLPEIRDYWARDPKMHYSPIASNISRNRFEEISRYLHFVDNAALPPRDEPWYHRLQKVLPLMYV